MTQYTQTPWHSVGSHVLATCSGVNPESKKPLGISIAAANNEANATRIVKCVNAYDKLISSLKAIRDTTTDNVIEVMAQQALEEAGAA